MGNDPVATDRSLMQPDAHTTQPVTELDAGPLAPIPPGNRPPQPGAWRQTGDSYPAQIVTEPALGLLSTALRWSTLAAGALLLAIGAAPWGRGAAVAAVLLAFNAVFRTVRPIRFSNGPAAFAELAFELAVTLTAVGASGATDSAFILTPSTPLVLAGLGAGYLAGFATTIVIVGGIATASLVGDTAHEHVRSASLLSLVFVTIAAACGFTRGLASEVHERQERLRGAACSAHGGQRPPPCAPRPDAIAP